MNTDLSHRPRSSCDTEQLVSYIRKTMQDLNLSIYEVAHRSGNNISSTALWRILKGTPVNIGSMTLKSLARGLGRSESEILEVVNHRLRQ
jgi:transcriptional regulator with XRE-family HTH domain